MIPRLVNKLFCDRSPIQKVGRWIMKDHMVDYSVIAQVNGEDAEVFYPHEVVGDLVVVVPTGATPTLAMPNPLNDIAEVVITHLGNEVVRRKDVYPGQAVGVLDTQLQPDESSDDYYAGEVVFSFTPQNIDREGLESGLWVLERHLEQCFGLLKTVLDPDGAAKALVRSLFREGKFDSFDVGITYVNEKSLAKLREAIASVEMFREF